MYRKIITLVSVLALSALAPMTALASGQASELSQTDQDRFSEVTKVVEVVEWGVAGNSKPLKVTTTVHEGPSALSETGLQLTADPEFAATSSCFWAKPKYYTYNGYGTMTYSYYYIEWCGSGGVVTSVPSLWCGGSVWQGGTYEGCSTNRGSLGYSRVYVNGNWDYNWWNVYHRDVEVDAYHYASGSYTGTWTLRYG